MRLTEVLGTGREGQYVEYTVSQAWFDVGRRRQKLASAFLLDTVTSASSEESLSCRRPRHSRTSRLGEVLVAS